MRNKNLVHLEFDESSTVDQVVEHLQARLSVLGSGHTVFCASRRDGRSQVCPYGCPKPPVDWHPPEVVRVALEQMVSRGLVERHGKFWWLKPAGVLLRFPGGVAQR